MSDNFIKKEGVSKITLYKLEPYFSADESLHDYECITSGLNIHGWKVEIYIRQSPEIMPSWQPLVKKYISGKENKFVNQNTSLVVLFFKDDQIFALAAGYGFINIKDFAVRNFGINVGLRTLNPNKLGHLYQKKPTGNVYGFSRALRGEYMPSNDQLNKKSVLKSIKGKVLDEDLGVTLDGKTSLSISGKKELDDVAAILDSIVEIEKREKLTVDIKSLDEVTPILSRALDEIIIQKIDNGEYKEFLLGYEDDIFLNNCDSVSVGTENNISIDDTDAIFSSALRQTSTGASSMKVLCKDDQGSIIWKGKLINLVEGEIDFEGKKYFRIDRKWYETNPEYVKAIEEEFKNVECVDASYLPQWPKGGDGRSVPEGDFLEICGKDKLITHTKTISKIEFADLVDTDKNYVIHVKKGTGAYLRNLFAQGYVSARLFHGDDSFRDEVRWKFNLAGLENFTVIFAIFPEDIRNADSIFTLFAKVDILERISALRELGYDVKYCIIDNC